jgi:hypothetical protein
MADKGIKRIKIVTPVGVAVFPRLGTPDTKFNALGVYSTRFRLSPEEAQPLMDQVDALQQTMFDAEVKRLNDAGEKAKAKKLKLVADKPYKPALDKEGDETGEIEFNFKLVAQYKDRTSGTMKARSPKVVDSKGKTIDGGRVWGGSKIKIGGYLVPFSTAIGVGVSLKLAQVMVLELVSGGGDSFDFGNNEGGYEAEEEEPSIGDNTANPNSGDTAGEPDEF